VTVNQIFCTERCVDRNLEESLYEIRTLYLAQLLEHSGKLVMLLDALSTE